MSCGQKAAAEREEEQEQKRMEKKKFLHDDKSLCPECNYYDMNFKAPHTPPCSRAPKPSPTKLVASLASAAHEVLSREGDPSYRVVMELYQDDKKVASLELADTASMKGTEGETYKRRYQWED